jgi:hypothetical protein
LLAFVHVKLLRFLTDNRLISADNWQHYLRKAFNDRYADESALKHYEQYADLAMADRLMGLHALTDMTLYDADRFRLRVKNADEEELWVRRHARIVLMV